MLNTLDRQRRDEQRLASIEEVAIRFPWESRNPEPPDGSEVWLAENLNMSPQELLQALRAELSGVEEQVLLLMLEGVRESARYAEVMGIHHWDESAQRREVKRVKDRLAKKLQRFGRKIDKA
jgi:hypothetical protein